MEEHFTPSKIDHIIADCVKTDDEQKSTRIGLFEQMIVTKMIDANDALPIVIKEIKNKSDIGLIIICLRHGADPNIYVDVKGLGPAHILIYAFYVHYEHNKSLFEIIYGILLLKGTSTMSTSYKPEFEPYSVISEVKMESCYEWIVNNSKGKFKLPAVASEMLSYVKTDKNKQIYAIFLNDTTICKWEPDMIQYLLYSRNPNWKALNVTEKDSIYLKIGFNATFADLVIAMLDDGLRPSYIDFSFWVAHYKLISSYQDCDYLIGECERMFIELIKRGFQIDLYYLDEIGSINPQFRTTLLDEYQRPLYSKICSYRNDEYIPDDIKNIALYLGVPEGYNKETFCNSIEHITSAELESIVKANQKRNMQSIGSRLNFLTDFINSSGMGMCDNRADFSENPLDYPGSLLAYYKDNSNKTWCFLSRDFEKLLHSKINPSTKTELPIEFLRRLEIQTETLKFFNVPLSEPKTISKLLLDIKKPETPTNTKTDEVVNRIKTVFASRGITEDYMIKKMKINELISKFHRVSIEINQILLLSESEYQKTLFDATTEFSPKMMFIIMCFILDEIFKKDVAQIDIFLR